MDPTASGLRSVHTTNLPSLLNQLGASLLVSTYQAGKLIVVRADGDQLNTHFRVFQKPMGLAVKDQKLAVGCSYQIWELHNIPAVAQKLDPAGKHDACFVPRMTHITGDIDIHEMAYGHEGLWFLNTRFSCLCRLDSEYSFVPRWRPPFVSAYDLTDRCHLNGLAMVDGIPRYVTALGETDTAGGWRANKANGGILMEITNNRILLRGLSMPHSPRWHQKSLWVLESGQGSLARVNLDQGTWDPICVLPGFTRGIDFVGSIAFIGLSKVRESAVFSGIPITQRLTERICGVWVVNIETGEILGFLRFEEGVEEIFAVQVLPNLKFPEVLGDPRFNNEQQEKILGSTYILPDDALKQVATTDSGTIFRPDLKEEDPEPVVTRFAVIVPIFNIENKGWSILAHTLQSIEESIAYFYQNYRYADHINHELILVDDGSTDQTWNLLQSWAHNKSDVHLIHQTTNQGQGAARNRGVAESKAQAIFFCDDDDLLLPGHILTCIRLLNRPLNPNTANPIYRLPGSYPAAIKTGLKIADPLHPYWYEQVKKVHTLNLCIRREAHDFVEGFPDELPFRKSVYGVEDQAYSRWITSFFSIIWIPEQTVEYKRYPGNLLDRQLKRFQSSPNTYHEPISSEQQTYLQQIEQITVQRQQYLNRKFDQDYNTDNLLIRSDQAVLGGDSLRAIQLLKRCLELNHDLEIAHTKLRSLETPLQLSPDRYLQLGIQAHAEGKRVEAADHFRRCLELQPDHQVARYNLGVTCGDIELWEEAEYHLDLALKQDPDNPQIYNSLGFICANQNRFEQAIEYYNQAILRDPQFADAHMNKGMALLKLGDLRQGWQEFEWRWQTKQFTPFQCPHPCWQGEDIADKTLLVHTEQGAGDAIQFVRFIPLTRQYCRDIVMVCPDHLARLFSQVEGIRCIYNAGQIPLSEFQVYVPLMSLPYCLDIGLDDIPSQIPYLHVPPLREGLLEKLEGVFSSDLLQVGICWAGSPTQGNDHNRSSLLRDWLPLLQIDGIQFHSLQKGPQAAQLSELSQSICLQDWDPDIRDYADTAAVISRLDFVISVDTSVVHLAGALGVPTWTLLCHNADWRWLLDREDSPYYPTMRLYRQQVPKRWDLVIAEVVEALKLMVDLLL